MLHDVRGQEGLQTLGNNHPRLYWGHSIRAHKMPTRIQSSPAHSSPCSDVDTEDWGGQIGRPNAAIRRSSSGSTLEPGVQLAPSAQAPASHLPPGNRHGPHPHGEGLRSLSTQPQGEKERLWVVRDRGAQVKDAWAPGEHGPALGEMTRTEAGAGKMSRVKRHSGSPFLWVLLPRDPMETVVAGTLCSGCESWLKHPPWQSASCLFNNVQPIGHEQQIPTTKSLVVVLLLLGVFFPSSSSG